eukprot:786948-Prymnesium_polylepis.1
MLRVISSYVFVEQRLKRHEERVAHSWECVVVESVAVAAANLDEKPIRALWHRQASLRENRKVHRRRQRVSCVNHAHEIRRLLLAKAALRRRHGMHRCEHGCGTAEEDAERNTSDEGGAWGGRTAGDDGGP